MIYSNDGLLLAVINICVKYITYLFDWIELVKSPYSTNISSVIHVLSKNSSICRQ